MDNFPDIFLKIKPLFDSIIKRPTREGITTLNDHLKRVDSQSVQILQNIFLQQLVILVDTVPGENQNELKTHLLDCIATILQKGLLRKAVAMKTTLLIAVKLIYDVDAGLLKPNLSEEYKLAVLKVISSVSRRIQSELVEEIYVRENLTLLSRAIFVCVSIIDTERYRKLRFQAVDAILSLLQIHDDFDFHDKVLRCQVAELLFIVLPKLLATFVTIINGDEKQGVAVQRIAIKAFGRTLGLVFEDYAKESVNEVIHTDQFRRLVQATLPANKEERNILGVGIKREQKSDYYNKTQRTREWLLEAEKQVEKLFPTILHLRGHEEELIRLEFAKMNCNLLTNCTYHMPTCTVHYLQSIITLCEDDSERIRDICQSIRNTVSSFTLCIEGNRIDDMFYETLAQAPRAIYRGEEREQIAIFRLISGYLRFFSPPQLTNVFSNANTLHQFIAILLAGSELENVNELVRREYVSYRFEYEEGFRLQKEKKESRWIALKNIQSPRAKHCFLQIFDALQHHQEQCMNTVFMYILEDFFTSRLNSNGYLYIMSELIPPAVPGQHSALVCSGSPLEETLKSVLAEVMQSYHWLLELDENDNVVEQKYNTLHVCLVIRIISKVATAMADNFKWYLYDSLRIILISASSTLNCINETAEMALDTIAMAMGLSSIQELVHQNLDYISQHITRCLRRTEHFRDGLGLLESVLRFVPYESSSVLESTVTPIVMNILHSYSQYGAQNSILCLRVLQIFIHSMRLRFNDNNPSTGSHQATSNQEGDGQKLSEQIKRFQNLLRREIANEADPSSLEGAEEDSMKSDDKEQTLEAEEEEEQPEEDDDYREDEKNLPSHIKIVLRILTVSFKYLASSNDAERIVALSTINEGIYMLERHENQLLPLVHDVWFNLTERFSDQNPAIVRNAFELLVTLAKLAKDFIRRRSLEEVFPKLYTFMASNWNADFSAHQVFKLQCRFLQSLPCLVQQLNFNEKQLDEALEVVRLYLEKCERRELQRHASECMQHMRAVDSLAVFLKCVSFLGAIGRDC
ncbi:TELO2-interacting protein 1 homolog [Anopheles albimanus]|uniref:TELO2-interacting protein 1 homolog n=1 Tax=Anopheles albimanus TaxID=7167 RepID=UPI00163F0DBA|nr:TELO2-interacting protein 1 homolog [Anopheles albimanus]